MRTLALLSLVCVCTAQPAETHPHPNGWRLIRLSPEIEFWASPDQINSLAVDNVPFIDVTDTYDLEQNAEQRANIRQSYPTTPAYRDLVFRIFPLINITNYFDNLRQFSTGFINRIARGSPSGVQAAEWLEEQVKAVSGGLGTTSRFENTQFPQFNVIHRIEGDGTDDNTVIIGAHLDSTAFGGFPPADPATIVAPGADDDGSGSMAILELLKALTQALQAGLLRLKRPIEFHWYAGEESGLVGSGNVAREYQSRRVPVYSMFQFDMIGYPASFDTPIGVTTDVVDPALTQFSRMLIDVYCKIEHANSVCGYGCSDHASWTRAGYPSAFPFEAPFNGGINPYIHTARDTIENGVDQARSLEFTHLGMAYLVEASLAA